MDRLVPALSSTTVDAHLDVHAPIDRAYPSLRQINSQPDIFVVDDFLTHDECDDMVRAASEMDMDQSPVVYGGYSEDAKVFSRLLPIPALLVIQALLNQGLPTWEVGTGGGTLEVGTGRAGALPTREVGMACGMDGGSG